MTAAAPDGIAYSLRRHHLADGERTTIYIVRHRLDDSRPRVQVFRQPRRLDHWCSRHGHKEAIVGGFYLRDPFRPLGDVVAGGRPRSPPSRSPRRTARAGRRCTRPTAGCASRRARRSATSATGDLVQAGPLLVADGRIVFDRADRRRGLLGRRRPVRLRHHRRPPPALGDRRLRPRPLPRLLRRPPLRRRRGADARRARRVHARPRLPRCDEPRRRRLDDARPPRPPAQPALQRAGPAGAGVAPDRVGDRGRAALGRPTRRAATPS